MPATTRDVVMHLNSLNSRKRKPIPAYFDDAAKFPPVYIFNIYDMEHSVPLGGLGSFLIPACELGAEYSAPCVVKGFIADEYDEADGNGKMSWNPEQGADVAKDVVGIGSSNPQMGSYTTNREWWGVFIAKGEKPSDEELSDAKKKLDQMMTHLVMEGDRLALQGPEGLKQIGPVHRRAVQWKKQKRDWATLPETMIDCPGCGDPIKPGVVKHSCGAILDMEKAIKLGMVPVPGKVKAATK